MADLFEDELTQVGNNNRFQAIAFLIMSFGYAIPASQTISNVFLSPERPFKCSNDDISLNISHNNLTNTRCAYRDNAEEEHMCTSWTFSTHIYKSTIQSHYDLVCDKSYIVQLCVSIYMVGSLAGAIFYGSLSDKFGRLRTVQLIYVNILVAGVVTPLMPTWPLYIIGRFFTGLSSGGYAVPPVYVAEIVGQNQRMIYLTALAVCFYVGYVFTAATAYIFPFHEYIEIIIGVVIVPAIFASLWLPESPRWLLSKNRPRDAHQALMKIANCNRKTVQCLQTHEESVDIDENSVKQRSATKKLRLLLKHSGIRRVTVFLSLCFFATALAYYGLLFSAEQYTENLFAYLAISAVAEGIAVALGGRLSAWLGRIPLLMLSSLLFTLIMLACVMCILLGINPIVVSVMAVAGRIIADILFCGLISYSPEVFPTAARNTGVGVAIFFSRFGGILAPEVGMFSRVWAPLPLIIYTCWALLAIISILFLPETKNRSCMETIGEAEVVYKQFILKNFWLKLRSTESNGTKS